MDKKIQISLDLYDILEYSTSALNYLKNKDKNTDVDEIIMYLSSIPETIGEIQKLLLELEMEKEKSE